MIDWQGSGEERLLSWRQFRLSLSNQSPEKAIKLINHEWSYCPFVSKYLPPHDNTEWPDPWTLLSDGKFCSLARALGMLYTISLCDQLKEYDLSLNIYMDISGKRYDLVIINNDSVLNYVHDTVVKTKQVKKDLKPQYQYSKADLQISKFR